MRLNKFLAQLGLGTRREVVDIIRSGQIELNGKTCTNPAIVLEPKDKVSMKGRELSLKNRPAYILLNKSHGYSCSRRGRGRNVFQLLQHRREQLKTALTLATPLRGLVFLTNDKDILAKASDLKEGLHNVMVVKLISEVTQADLDALNQDTSYISWSSLPAETAPYTELMVKGKGDYSQLAIDQLERVKMSWETMDRISIMGITKKGVGRLEHRDLKEKELVFVKHFGTKKPSRP